MSPKICTQEFKNQVVRYYEHNHTISETPSEFGISESSLFEWRKQYAASHDLIVDGTTTYKNHTQTQMHLRKTEYILEVIRQAPCGVNATIDEKMREYAEFI